GHLFHQHTITHSYPHDWRGKSPVIFRATEQWFIGVDTPLTHAAGGHAGKSLRELALTAAEREVQFVPEWGKNRMRGMLESRPDWCISRQRAWGLPIPTFFTPHGGVLMTAASVRAVARVVREKGSDAWFQQPPEELLKYYDSGADADPQARAVHKEQFAALKKGNDILDVWFE